MTYTITYAAGFGEIPTFNLAGNRDDDMLPLAKSALSDTTDAHRMCDLSIAHDMYEGEDDANEAILWDDTCTLALAYVIVDAIPSGV